MRRVLTVAVAASIVLFSVIAGSRLAVPGGAQPDLANVIGQIPCPGSSGTPAAPVPETSPVADGTAEAIPGVTHTRLSAGKPSFDPLFTLRLNQVVFDPGAAIPEDLYPAAVATYVVCGSLVLTVVPGNGSVAVNGEDLDLAATPEGDGSPVAPVEVVLHQGDSVYFDRARYSLRNDEAVAAVVLNAVLMQDPIGCPPCPQWP